MLLLVAVLCLLALCCFISAEYKAVVKEPHEAVISESEAAVRLKNDCHQQQPKSVVFVCVHMHEDVLSMEKRAQEK